MTGRPTIPALGQLFLDVLAAAQPTTLAGAARRAEPARVVEVSGSAGGVELRAPLSGRPCVWHRSVTSPFYEHPGARSGGRLQRISPPPVVPSSAFPSAPGVDDAG